MTEYVGHDMWDRIGSYWIVWGYPLHNAGFIEIRSWFPLGGWA